MKNTKIFLSTGLALTIALFSSVQLSGMKRTSKVPVQAQIDLLEANLNMLTARYDALADLLITKGIISRQEMGKNELQYLKSRNLIRD